MNSTVSVDIGTGITVNEFRTLINHGFIGWSNYTVDVIGESANLCASTTASKNTIYFNDTWGAGLPMAQILHSVGDVDVYVGPDIDAVDTTYEVWESDGLYTIQYTPTIAGSYDIAVMIDSTDVSNDLVDGVLVTPALEYAPSSTHNISQVNREGETEYFTVQLRDRFGNELDGPLATTSEFMVTMEGTVAQCQLDSGNDTTATSIPVSVLDREPYTDGVYTFIYDPTTAGSYELSVKVLTRGGLLATYYKDANHSNPVLASLGHLHDGIYHDPYWCDGLVDGNFSTSWTFGPVTSCDPTIADCGCDSTRLDESLSFDWGSGTPLPYDEPYSGKFPNDFFSVKWEGYITAPMTGTYTITVVVIPLDWMRV
jgi:hypothetical protein